MIIEFLKDAELDNRNHKKGKQVKVWRSPDVVNLIEKGVAVEVAQNASTSPSVENKSTPSKSKK